MIQYIEYEVEVSFKVRLRMQYLFKSSVHLNRDKLLRNEFELINVNLNIILSPYVWQI